MKENCIQIAMLAVIVEEPLAKILENNAETNFALHLPFAVEKGELVAMILDRDDGDCYRLLKIDKSLTIGGTFSFVVGSFESTETTKLELDDCEGSLKEIGRKDLLAVFDDWLG